MWGGSEEKESIETIRAALDQGVTVVDKAPVYGFGRSEEIVGKALATSGLRSRVIATKVGLEWRDGKVFRNASRERITREVEARCGVCAPITSISTRCTGRTPWCRWRKPLPRCDRFMSRERSAPSG